MPSPDVRPYVDLTLFDGSAQAVYMRALDYVRTALPEYQPREGTVESVILQAFAQEVQEAINSINRIPGAITEVLLRLLDVERNNGTRATAVVKFIAQTMVDQSIPGGVRMYYQAATNSDVLLLETTSPLTLTHDKIITSISQTLTTATVTTATRHGLSVGNTVTITGTGVSGLDNYLSSVAVTSVGATGYTFTLTSTNSGSFSATLGTVTPANSIPATGFVNVQTTAITESFNGLASGTALRILSVVPSVASAELATTLTGGVAAESDTEYFSRGTSTLGRLSAALVTAQQIEQYVVEGGNFPDAYRVKVADTTNAGRVGGYSSNVMIAVSPIDGSPNNLLSGVGNGSVTPTSSSYGVLDQVYDGINERLHAGLSMSVTHPSYITLAVTATVALPDGLSANAVSTACVATLNSYLSPNMWGWSTAVRASELIVQLRNTTLDVGTVTYAATDYVKTVSVVPTDFYVPSTSTYNRWSITQRARTSNVATITTSAAHGMTIGANETLYLKVAGFTGGNTGYNTETTGTYIVAASSASGSTFTYANTGSNEATTAESSGYVMALAKYNSSTNVLTLLDPAPLIISGTHSVTAS